MKNNDPNFQLQLAFIDRSINENPVQQRLLDGYINATALCKACNKNFADYYRLKTTSDFINTLISDMGIPISAVIQIVKGGNMQHQGTWVHPQIAINLAQWASPKFAVAVTKWVFDWMQGNIKPQSNIPYHLQRYLLNRGKIPNGYFSVFNEIVYCLIAPLEDFGYTLPDKLVPDISEGKVFCNWLRKEKGIDPSNFPTYEHEYADGRTCKPKLYPNSLLPDFREHFSTVWLLEKAHKYFNEKDPTALPFIQKMMLQLPKSEQIQLLPNKDNSNNNLFQL